MAPPAQCGQSQSTAGCPPRHSAVILLGGSRRGTRAFPPGFPRASMNGSSCGQEAARDPELLGLKGTQASRVLQMLTQPGIRAMPAACKAHALPPLQPPQLKTQEIFLELPCPTVRAAAKTRSRSAAPESVVGGRGQCGGGNGGPFARGENSSAKGKARAQVWGCARSRTAAQSLQKPHQDLTRLT